MLCTTLDSFSLTLYCTTIRKIERTQEYTKQQLEKYQFATKLEWYPNKESYLSRCGFSPLTKKIDCDRYLIDKIEEDPNVHIYKFYVFRSQFNFQLFPDFTSIEDNGRGGLAYQDCKLIESPE